ncbi:MAG: response regulator [Candidatus Solibacter sp.]|nr:response regulator [Candidatus Solibacter sp.]
MSEPTRTVLIVDDDPQILRLVRAMLGPHDVNVLSAPRPSDALRICGEETVDLLISDVAMPEMDGNKLAERVLKLHPRVSVLLISGEVNEAPAVKGRRVRFLKKPFFPAELIRLLREMLADKAECA